MRTEIIAGITTFLAMACILLVNPTILSATGMDKGSVFVATCLAAAIGSLLMGLIANYPIALAPGMGLNAFFTYTVVLHMGYTWQIALGAVFLSALIFFALSIFKIREWIIASIPLPLRSGIAFGFITWTLVKLLSGRRHELNAALIVLSVLFVIKLGWLSA